jgi:hypothetical protein
MQPVERFKSKPKRFWANVRTISQAVGYTTRGQGEIKIPTIDEISSAYKSLGLTIEHLYAGGSLTAFGEDLLAYFETRSKLLHSQAEPNLMDAAALFDKKTGRRLNAECDNTTRAKREFERLKLELCPKCPIPENKQKGDKKAPAYFTGMINMLIESASSGAQCNYDPRELTTITKDGVPLRTLARRVDGAFPSVVDPVAIWEIKEYYYTTTFGSRVADGVYETLLDGMELEELREHEGRKVRHYLFVDSHYTWWECGKSYLCRIVDMLHMGYVDEVLFGREIIDRVPALVSEWVELAKES